jgi:hypothetical protein
MSFARGRANSQALSAFSLRFIQGKIPGSIHLAGCRRRVGQPAWGKWAGTPFGDVPAHRVLGQRRVGSGWQWNSSFWQNMQSKSHFVMENHPITSGSSLKGSRHSEWFMGLEINTSAAGSLSPISGDAREILSSQTGLLLPLPPTAGNLGMAAASFGIPGHRSGQRHRARRIPAQYLSAGQWSDVVSIPVAG